MNSAFDGLLLNPRTKAHLLAFIDSPAQAVLISGPKGSGKKHLARILSAQLLGVDEAKLLEHPQFFLIEKAEDRSEIPIDDARRLIAKLSLKVPGQSRAVDRIALIQDADKLSGEAQNSLLKIIEEPPPRTLLMLTSSAPQDLLPTVISRLQALSVLPVGLNESQEFFRADFGRAEAESAWRLSRGAPALMASLLSQGGEHQLKNSVEEAKRLVSMKRYDRICYLQAAAKDKEAFGRLLDGLARVLAALHQAAALKARQPSGNVLRARRQVNLAQDSLVKNTNPRLVALHLALELHL